MDVDTQPRRRLGLWGWLLLVTGVLGLAVVVTAFWVRTSFDLDALRQRAVGLGLHMTWVGLGPDRPIGDDARLIHEAAGFAARAKQYDGIYGYGYSTPFGPVPPEFSSWQLAGGSGVDADVDRCIDALSGAPGQGFDARALTEAAARRDAGRLSELLLLDERIELHGVLMFRVMAGVDDPAALAARIARLAASQPLPVVFAQTSSVRLAGLWATQVQRRREELDPRQVASEAQVIAERLEATLPQVVAGHPLFLETLMRLPVKPLFRSMNIRLPAAMVVGDGMFMDLFFRIGRGPILERAIVTADWCRRHGTPRTSVEVIAAAPGRPRPTVVSAPRELLSSMLDEGWCQHCGAAGQWSTALHALLLEQLRTTTRLRLIAADNLGEPWPVDPCDPAGGRLREIRRDGHMIGAYSLGADGVDDGADVRRDWCWPLREQLGQRRAADQPYAP